MLISMLGPPLHLHTLRAPVQTRYALMRYSNVTQRKHDYVYVSGIQDDAVEKL